jgi:TfoX/Sxy family transcriptional regulator of competence genes
MSTSKETVAFILDQLAPLPVRARAMFGEYGVYCEEKFVALICDDTLFLKPLPVLAGYFNDPEMAPPYPGAKDHFVVSAELLENRDWLHEVFVRTAESVPLKKR